MFALLLLTLFAEVFGLAQAKGGIVTGQVLSVDGTPAVGVRVAALTPPDSNPGAAGAEILASLTMTDSAGHYRLENIYPGQYYIRAGPTDYLSYYPGVTNLANAKLVEVKGDATVGDVNFGLSQSAKVSGHVAAAMSLQSAIPLSVVLVAPNGQTLETPVHPDGTFEFPRVAPASYTAMMLPNIGSQAGVRPLTISVAKQDIDGLELGGGIGVRVSGRVTGAKTSSLTVRMQAPAGSNQVLESSVNADGTFTFSWVPPGAYVIWTLPNMGGSAVAALLVTDKEIRDIELKSIDPTISRVSVRGRVAPEFSSPANILLDSPLQPTSQIAQLRPLSGSTTLQATIRPDGTFEFPNVGTGFAFALATFPNAIPPIPVAVSDRDITNIEFGTDRATHALVKGHVTRASSTAAPLPPGMLLSRPDLGSFALNTAVGPDGTFEFRDLTSGTYLAQTLSTPVVTSTVVVNGKDITDADIVLPSRFDFSGRVVTENGNSLPSSSTSAQIWAIGAAGLGVGPSLQADGGFKLSLSAGEYRIATSGLPLGYFLKSVTYGSTDLLKTPLKIDGPPIAELRVTFGIAPADSVRGVKVSGQVNGLPAGTASRAAIRLLALTVADGPTVEGPLSANGTFELPKVPPGTYVLRVIGTPSQNFPTSVVVGDEDVPSVAVLMRP